MIPQRNPRSPRILSVRPMVKDDLEALRQPVAKRRLSKLRERHHYVARMIAAGHSPSDIAEDLGYCYQRVLNLAQDPALQELVAKYRGMVDESWRQHVEAYQGDLHAVKRMNARMLREHYEDLDLADDRPSLKDMVKVNADLSDRVGISKKSLNLNVNVDFAARLEAARKRSQLVLEGKADEAQPT